MASAEDTPISPTTGLPVPKYSTHTGGCHCGMVLYSVKLSPPLYESPVTSCNCSICHINGQLMVYPLESQITWHSGKDEMTGYSFGPEKVSHFFCSICGTSICGKSNDPRFFGDNRALNVRCFRDVDLDQLKIRKYDGKTDLTNKEFAFDETKHPHNGYGPRIDR